MKHVKLFEEIGFDYSSKPAPEDPFGKEEEEPISFSLGGIEKPFKNISKSAFNAGRKTTMTFDEWWAKTWNMGEPKEPKERKTLARSPIGFRSSRDAEPTQTPVDIENRPKRITPNKPGRPGRPAPRPKAPPTPGKPKRRSGIWFEE